MSAWLPLGNRILGFMLNKGFVGESGGEDGSRGPSSSSTMAVWKHWLSFINKTLLLVVVAWGWKLLQGLKR